MLLWILDWLSLTGGDDLAALGKITFRAALAAMVSFAVALVWGPRLIAWLKARFREPIVSPSEKVERLHRPKQWTPTMGGLFIVGGVVASTLAFGNLTNPYVLVCLLLAIGMATLGAIDDLTKLRTRKNGLPVRAKLAGQIAIALVAALLVYHLHRAVPGGLELHIPLTATSLQLGWLFVPLAVLVIVAASNAVNLTDGLDGLAGGCLVFATAGMGIMAYVAGHCGLAAYLNVTHVPAAGETVVIAGAMIGGLLGFLWFNCHPAQVFMGDVGSLPLGGLLGMLAITARAEFVLVVVGGVFVIEAASVILQVAAHRWRKRRILLCAPLHHHFQFKGWPEGQIVVRFWIVAALCAILGVAGTKLSLRDRTPGGGQQASAPSSPVIQR